MSVELVILNYNGRHLLAECLPSILHAAAQSQYECRITVIDNSSQDDSREFLTEQFPEVEVVVCPNRGLASYNDVLRELPSRTAVLLNNDVRLAADAIDPLVAPLATPLTAADENCFMTTPLCWRFDGQTYEGLKTAVRWRWGLVQATALYEGHEAAIHLPGFTASAGAILAVDREKFLRLGGFDPLYFPGRLEDLDLSFRAYQAGYHARYIPQAVAYHAGCATFDRELGRPACDRLALRNTLLFQWKNLRDPLHIARQIGGLLIRLACDVLSAPRQYSSDRWPTWRAVCGALQRLRAVRHAAHRGKRNRQAEREFFRMFHPRAIDRLNSLAMSISRRHTISKPHAVGTTPRNRLLGFWPGPDANPAKRNSSREERRRW